jgi:hypothetical protein
MVKHLNAHKIGWTKKQLLDAINHFTFNSLQLFINSLLTQNNFIESFM